MAKAMKGEGADGTSCRIVEARSDCAARVISWRFYRTGGARLPSPSRVRLRSGLLGGCREFRASAGRHGTRLIEPGESLQFDLNSLITCPEFAVPDPRAVTSTGYKRCLIRCFSPLTVKCRAEMADRFPVLFPDTGNPWQRRFSRRLHPPPFSRLIRTCRVRRTFSRPKLREFERSHT